MPALSSDVWLRRVSACLGDIPGFELTDFRYPDGCHGPNRDSIAPAPIHRGGWLRNGRRERSRHCRSQDVRMPGHQPQQPHSACLLRQGPKPYDHQHQGRLRSILRTAGADVRRLDGRTIHGSVFQSEYQGIWPGWPVSMPDVSTFESSVDVMSRWKRPTEARFRGLQSVSIAPTSASATVVPLTMASP